MTVLRYADKRIVNNIMKVYIERNNVQLELQNNLGHRESHQYGHPHDSKGNRL